MKRTFSIAMFAALLVSVTGQTSLLRADEAPVITIHAQTNAHYVDFATILGKRSDLRTDVSKRGLDVAFSAWLKSEHAFAYRSATTSAALNSVRFANDPKSAYVACCTSTGNCCHSNCAQCCAKGPCKMGCCNMQSCKAIGNACCK